METKVINMTPHEIIVEAELVDYYGETATYVKRYPASGEVVRMETKSKTVSTVDGFSVVKNIVVGSNLPEPKEGVYLLVSAMVLAAFPDRKDLLAPNTGAAKRNDKGHIVSVPGFISN